MIFTFAIALVVGAVISLALGSWWILGAAVAVHAIATALVLGVVARRLQEADKPDPITEARIEEAEAEREPEGPRIRTDPIHLR